MENIYIAGQRQTVPVTIELSETRADLHMIARRQLDFRLRIVERDDRCVPIDLARLGGCQAIRSILVVGCNEYRRLHREIAQARWRQCIADDVRRPVCPC